MAAPPAQISARAFAAAATFLADYFAQMAERVYGDAATERERGAATLAAEPVCLAAPVLPSGS
jgi:hypothetical protein